MNGLGRHLIEESLDMRMPVRIGGGSDQAVNQGLGVNGMRTRGVDRAQYKLHRALCGNGIPRGGTKLPAQVLDVLRGLFGNLNFHASDATIPRLAKAIFPDAA